MKKIIVTTTINPVTEAVRRFQSMKSWDLVVVGDKKTPGDYRLEKGTFLTPSDQEAMDQELSDTIGWNCIQRRNFGILWAYKQGADVIAVVDDDNIPDKTWGENLLLGRRVEVSYFETDQPAFDPVGATNERHLWHRGFPLQLISTRNYDNKTTRLITPDVQADFWNGDPDIDAFCRMEHAPECRFDPGFFPMASNAFAPFNSQNTFLSRKILKDYFLFPHIGRMDDIWASYYVQAKLKAQVVFSSPSVYQQRNPHDLTRDMRAEYLGYEHNLTIVKEIKSYPDRLLDFLPERSLKAYRLYQRHFL